ncbi:Phosphoribosylglycinamide formyltransferase [bioreactor metagenome]|uniref:phosphoribosylglycinamide formyltransferase 1 n=1 Tax=bioreactor metagenome TaxID=1076179 RepID=A0A644ZG25_9ZZZZ
MDALVVERAQFSTQEAFEAALIETLEAYAIDIIVLAGFMLILSAGFVARYPDRIINVHPSLIPAYCGKGYYGIRVHEAVLAAGERETGATVHMVNEVPDGGRILLQKTVPVLPLDTPETLQRRVMEQAEWQLLPQAAEMVCQEWMKQSNGGKKIGTKQSV